MDMDHVLQVAPPVAESNRLSVQFSCSAAEARHIPPPVINCCIDSEQ